jgi:hypothetical protein
MSAPVLDLEERPAVRVEPAKQWRNWYWVIAPIKLHTQIQALWGHGTHLFRPGRARYVRHVQRRRVSRRPLMRAEKR